MKKILVILGATLFGANELWAQEFTPSIFESGSFHSLVQNRNDVYDRYAIPPHIYTQRNDVVDNFSFSLKSDPGLGNGYPEKRGQHLVDAFELRPDSPVKPQRVCRVISNVLQLAIEGTVVRCQF